MKKLEERKVISRVSFRFSRKKKIKDAKSDQDLAGKDSMEIVNELKQVCLLG